jgi:hypothetical protein
LTSTDLVLGAAAALSFRFLLEAWGLWGLLGVPFFGLNSEAI